MSAFDDLAKTLNKKSKPKKKTRLKFNDTKIEKDYVEKSCCYINQYIVLNEGNKYGAFAKILTQCENILFSNDYNSFERELSIKFTWAANKVTCAGCKKKLLVNG